MLQKMCVRHRMLTLFVIGDEVVERISFHDDADVPEGNNATLNQACNELREYLDGYRKTFTFPIRMKGTAFQRRVWEALLTIPYGEVRTYREIAMAIGCPNGYRAVGMANHVNRLPIVIPCHRVIGTNGKAVGYAGGLDIKRRLLELEGVTWMK